MNVLTHTVVQSIERAPTVPNWSDTRKERMGNIKIHAKVLIIEEVEEKRPLE
jgi:hypothetical protein